jgi:DNA sulfur modification protein DndE
MKPPSEHIRLSKQSRDQLINLKRHTGVATLNILCRWAYAISIKDPTPPPIPRQTSDGGFDIAWGVFVGEQHVIIEKTLLLRAQLDNFDAKGTGIAPLLRAHIQRGLSYLANKKIRSITDLAIIATSN